MSEWASRAAVGEKQGRGGWLQVYAAASGDRGFKDCKDSPVEVGRQQQNSS